MTTPCNTDKIIAQTLFLGASVSNFNVSKGWGGQSSQLTVNLVEDATANRCTVGFVPATPATPGNPAGRPETLGKDSNQFNGTPPSSLGGAHSVILAADSDSFAENHYHTCDGDACYVNLEGNTYNSSTMRLEDRMVPGKVFYQYNPASTGFVSKYWYNGDPGFFGKPNKIDINNIYSPNNPPVNKGYDIIDTPVYFKMGDFSFGGIVQSWSESQGASGKNYSVTVVGMESVLNNCYLILDKFAGAVYSKKLTGTDNRFAGPRNYAGRNGVSYFDEISNGNIPNVFNIYGFLESFGRGGFGGAGANKEGISANKIIKALIALTSNDTNSLKNQIPGSNTTDKDYGPKQAFSPYGRIVTKCMQEQETYDPIATTFNRFGVLAPSSPLLGESGSTNKCQFVLDLSDLPQLPDDFRISGPVISIIDLINTVTEQTGYDYHINLYPNVISGSHIIKVHTINRLNQPATNEIGNTIKLLQAQGYLLSSITYGKEKNETQGKHLLIGGSQQRLYQAKSLRLAYSQSNYIFNPTTNNFIDYMKMGNWSKTNTAGQTLYHHGKIKLPTALSTRNVDLSNIINPSYSGLYKYDQEILKDITSIGGDFNALDAKWNDNLILSSTTIDTKFGNYGESAEIKQKNWPAAGTIDSRFFPIHMDVICPFFGFVLDNEVNINTAADSNNDFRRIRPVWFDTWTGQLVVVIRTKELPVTDIDLENLATMSDVGYFLLTENEIRAALAGFDNFLVYCLSKTYKNDLIEMLRRAYKLKYFNDAKRANSGITDEKANIEADRRSDWYWKLLGGNIAGAFNQTISITPDKGDGSAELDPAVVKDLQILHNFVNEIGKFYGKKYMVLAPALKTYRDESFANIILSTQVGNAYVFGGGGDLHYNYTPTNDGAWEEYGNIIDDSLPVGGKEWYNLTDDMGKIKPILGYNNNEYFDYVRYNICKLTQAQTDNYRSLQKIDPFWSYSNYEYIMGIRDSTCNQNRFLLPSIDFSSLANTDYVNVEVKQAAALPALVNNFQSPLIPSVPPNYSFNSTTAKDAWGSGLGTGLKKLYVTTSVEENIVFLNPDNLSHPRILIDAPGLVLNSSSNQYAKDPNRTVISNIAVEDLSIYLHTVATWDYNWINFMLSYISPISSNGFMIGNFAGSANQSANFVELAPKAAHPFFAGIPVKSNQYGYGPWTNYPILNYTGIFPTGKNIVLNPPANSTSDLPTPTITDITVNEATAKKAINNWIGPTNVEVIEEFVPWNYGGMAFLDIVAHNEIEKKLNYQSVLESAQIDMPGLPLFGLGGGFTSGNLSSPNMTTMASGISFRDVKDNHFISTLFDLMPMASALYIPPSAVLSIQDLNYSYVALTGLTNYTVGPIITNIQTSMGQQGIQTTYSFRTYTKKIGLFNKENSDRIKKSSAINLRRNKQLANIQQQSINTLNTQSRFLQEKRLENARIGGKDFSSKLFGWSPSTVFIAQSQPYIKYLETDPAYLEPTGLYSSHRALDTRTPSTTNILSTGLDVGSDSVVLNTSYLTDSLSNVSLGNTLRHKTSVGMYELKEVDAQIENDYGMQSVMSLDGLFSPVSFYPTFKNSTFSYTLYSTSGVDGVCPFCKGTKIRKADFASYKTNGSPTVENMINIYCDRCARLDQLPTSKLQSTITTSSTSQSIETLPPYIITSGTDIKVLLEFNALSNSSSSISVASTSSASSSSSSKIGVAIPINLVNLNPIVVPYGNLKNQNVQAYLGVHPEGSGIHEDLSIGIFTSSAPRTFFDRSRHSIEIVGRGSVKPKNLSIHNSLGIYPSGLVRHQPDFYSQDLLLQQQIKDKENIDVVYPMNQRFVGLRGPMVMHGWGYDLAGYPVPNAADEPYEINKYGQPRRFKIRLKEGYPKTVEYKALKQGSLFEYTPTASVGVTATKTEYIKTATLASQGIPGLLETSNVSEFIYEDDLSNGGGFPSGTTENGTDRTSGYQGSIISKTQMWTATGATVTSLPGQTGGKWSEKKKLKEFYLNWAERPDLWPVGPIDLRWDENRRVWTTKSSDVSLYKMVYVTLEQDLVKSEDTDETYPARGFLDDIEYSAEPLPNDFRRLVYLKDRGGYTAPRGAKLLCRYDKDSGYYEPVSKQSFVVGGVISNGSSATIEMSYVQGRKRGEPVPTMAVSFDNPFSFNTISGNKGLFTFMNGKWTLTAAKEN